MSLPALTQVTSSHIDQSANKFSRIRIPIEDWPSKNGSETSIGRREGGSRHAKKPHGSNACGEDSWGIGQVTAR